MPARVLAILVAAMLSFAASSGRTTTLQWDTNTISFGAGGLGKLARLQHMVERTLEHYLGLRFGRELWPGAGTVTVNGTVTADSLSFSTTGYTINATITGSPMLTLSGADTIEVTNSGDTATISASLGGSGGFTKTGAGTLTFVGNLTANSYSGTATVADGTLNLDKPSRATRSREILLSATAPVRPPGAIVTQGADNQIADTATVTIHQDGFWNLASGNHSETIGGLVVTYESSVATGSGKLTLMGDVTTSILEVPGDYPGATISGLLDLGGATRTFTRAPLSSCLPRWTSRPPYQRRH